ncbi:hypothetical protein E4U55_000696 [Claviceps digitariae]|nr:hypothetical protein E4U55_000696 [Claviceps digitariae]
MSVSSLLAALLVSSAAILSFLPATAATATTTTSSDANFDWLSLQPSWHLNYTSCYHGFDCARIHMPLDWLNRRDNRTVTLAVLRLPATVPVGDPRHGGTLMVNPGGPGVSGVVHMLDKGRYIQRMVDSPERRFEVLSFDARGVALSTPRADCYTSEAARRAAEWQARGWKPGQGLDTASLKRALVRGRAHGLKCAGYRGAGRGLEDENEDEEGVDFNVHEFMATASVARDMLRLVDEVEEERRQRRRREEMGTMRAMAGDAQRSLGGGVDAGGAAGAAGGDDIDGGDNGDGVDGGSAVHDAPPRLQFYGMSYGTVLGNTFLSMFPGRVKRMMLDGVVIADNWVRGNWDETLTDTHLAIDYFYQTCFHAGARCALRTASDSSWHAIQQRVDALVARLDQEPVPGAPVDGPEVVIDGGDVLGLLSGQLYSPLDLFEGLASTLADAVGGNYTRLLAELVPPMRDHDRHNHDDDDDDDDDDDGKHKDHRSAADQSAAETFSSVACGDTHNLGHYPLSHWQRQLQNLQARYHRLTVPIVEQTVKCAGWQSHPRDRFAGPFRSPAAEDSASHTDDDDDSNSDNENNKDDKKSKPGRPSAPLLLLSTLYDPITPLNSARVVARSHPGSRVLVQNSVGHCTLWAGPSGCTWRVMQAYMANGTMPQEGLVCEGDCVPFEGCAFERGVVNF